MQKWPNFFIVGAPKAGTTSLYAYLKETKDIYMSPVKEPRYFQIRIPESYLPRISDKAKYLKLFRKVTDEKAIGEATPTYLQDPESAKLIHNVVPDARIIILLRDPVERAFSHYLTIKSQGIEKNSFHNVIKQSIEIRLKGIEKYNTYLDHGLYAKAVKRYVNIFGTNKVKILIFEEFIKDPKKTIQDVLDFLGVKSEPPQNVEQSFNVYAVPRGKFGLYIYRSKTLAELSKKIIPFSLKWKLKENLILKKEKKPVISKEDKVILESFYRNESKDLQSF